MVKQLLAGCDIQNKPVLEAMRRVPRHLFIPENMRRDAYEDHPVPIGQRQPISQPYIVAFMTQALKLEKDDRVLEIGTGSGYQAAILGELAGEIYTIEKRYYFTVFTPFRARNSGTHFFLDMRFSAK